LLDWAWNDHLFGVETEVLGKLDFNLADVHVRRLRVDDHAPRVYRNILRVHKIFK